MEAYKILKIRPGKARILVDGKNRQKWVSVAIHNSTPSEQRATVFDHRDCTMLIAASSFMWKKFHRQICQAITSFLHFMAS